MSENKSTETPVNVPSSIRTFWIGAVVVMLGIVLGGIFFR